MLFLAKFVIILETFHICHSICDQNVGSVLFSSNDLLLHRWTQSELASLRARRHFQNLLPPPKLTHTISDEYLSYLLNYVGNCFSTVIKEADNPTEKDLLYNALSDVVGGYLKVWVLPITKYAYYGGTISPINALKLFQMYEDIKQTLKTDGGTWRNPNENSLKTVSINIASNPHDWFTRSTRESCDRLSYYEKSDMGLTIPLPYINWELYPQTMFIPLKDQSLIQLKSPNSTNALLDYYNVATSCIHSSNLGTIDDFGSRFQIWLSTDVVPHLKDDDLYVAFGSCLSLLNKTKGLYNNVINLCDNAYSNLRYKAASSAYPFPLTKKSVFVAIILLIEVIWCIPVLYYLLCGKKSKNKRGVKRFFTYFRKDPPTLHGVKLFVKPRTRNLELDVEFPTYDHKYYMKTTSTNVSQNNVYNNVTHINESIKQCSQKVEHNHIINNKECSKPMSNMNITKTTSKHICNCKSICDNRTSCYFTSSQTINSSSNGNSAPSYIVLEENEIKNLSYTHATLSVSKSTLKGGSDIKLSNLKSDKGCAKCPCTSCIKNGTDNEQVCQCLKNIEKTNIKVKKPIVMKVINENRREGNSSCVKQITQKVELIKTNSTKGNVLEKELDRNTKKENISRKKEGETCDKSGKTLPDVAKNSSFLRVKLTKICKDKIANVRSGKCNNIKPIPARVNKQQIKPQNNVQNNKIEMHSTFIKTNTVVSTRDESAIAEVPKENKNTENNIAENSTQHNVKKVIKPASPKEDSKTPKRIETSKNRSAIPKLSHLPRKTIISADPGIKSSTPKPCKIPKRILTTAIRNLKGPVANTTTKTSNERKTQDDSAIKKRNDKNKLNTTF